MMYIRSTMRRTMPLCTIAAAGAMVLPQATRPRFHFVYTIGQRTQAFDTRQDPKKRYRLRRLQCVAQKR